jgi:hypothetical protein
MQFQKEGAVSSNLYIFNLRQKADNLCILRNTWGLDGVCSAKYVDNNINNNTTGNNNALCKSKTNNVSKRYTAGGVGHHTVCFYTPSSDLQQSLGSKLHSIRGTGTGSLVCVEKNICNICNQPRCRSGITRGKLSCKCTELTLQQKCDCSMATTEEYSACGYTVFIGSEYVVNIVGELTSSDYNTHILTAELKQVIVGSNVTSIGISAFQDCANLTTIIIPKSVTTLGDNAFYNCKALTDISFYDIADSVLSDIGEQVFWNCENLISISIPKQVQSFGEKTFYNCYQLISITFDPDSSLNSIGNNCFEWNIRLQSITIPKLVTSLGSNAFSHCRLLTDVSFVLESSLTTIGESCFKDCLNLPTITIPKSVTLIDYQALWKNKTLTSILFEDISNSQLTTIGEKGFDLSSNISNITLPPSLTSVGANFISNCSDLSYIEFLGTRPDLASRLASEDLSGDINPGVFSNLRTAGVDPSTNIIVSGTDPSWNKINSIDGYPMKHFFELLKNGASFKLRNDAGYLYLHDASHPNGSQYLFTSNEISGSVFKLEQPANILDVSGEIIYALYDTLNSCYLRHNDFILRCSTLAQLDSYPLIDWAWSFGKVQYENVFYGTHTVIRNYYSNPTIMYDSGGNIPKIYDSSTWSGNILNPGLSDAQIDFYFELV